MAKTPEGEIVQYAKEKLKARGCLVRKISYEMRRGCPDLLVLVPERLAPAKKGYPCLEFRTDVLFLEIKKDEQTKPDPHQVREHARMVAVGADVRVIGSRAQVDALIKELFPNE